MHVPIAIDSNLINFAAYTNVALRNLMGIHISQSVYIYKDILSCIYSSIQLATYFAKIATSPKKAYNLTLIDHVYPSQQVQVEVSYIVPEALLSHYVSLSTPCQIDFSR